jgi:hypothetical protein
MNLIKSYSDLNKRIFDYVSERRFKILAFLVNSHILIDALFSFFAILFILYLFFYATLFKFWAYFKWNLFNIFVILINAHIVIILLYDLIEKIKHLSISITQKTIIEKFKKYSLRRFK